MANSVSLLPQIIKIPAVIDSGPKLDELLPKLKAAPWLAVDTEADSLHSYPEKLCLLQISYPDHDDLVDTLADIDLQPLWDTLQPREMILHGADYDLRLFSKHHSFVPSRIFDTMIAARLLGVQQFGLANLVKDYLNIELEKGPQKSDWSKRPLTERMEQYARNDTRHLRELSQLLIAELEKKDRLAWCDESCARQVSDNSNVAPPDPDRVWRIKRSSKLPRPAMAILREIWKWREQEATRANKPPFFVLKHESLIEIADTASAGQPWDRLIPRRYSPRRRRDLVDAIERGLACPADQHPHPIRNRSYHASEEEKANFAKLKSKRDIIAEKLEIDPTLIASKETMEGLTRRENEAAWAKLMNWQRELLN